MVVHKFLRERSRAFSLMEILVAVAVIGVLAALLVPAINGALARSREAKSVGNLSVLGRATLLYVADNDGNLPVRQPGSQWPGHVYPYLDGDKRVFADPNAKITYLTENKDPLFKKKNFTSYIVNSLDDLVDKRPAFNMLTKPSDTIFLAVQSLNKSGNGFAMNIVGGDYNDKPLKTQFRDGSYYLFAEGSVRFVPVAEYSGSLWVADKSEGLPQPN